MIAFLVDRNFNEHIVDGLDQRNAALDLNHVRDLGLAAAPDPELLERAAAESRVILTHDGKTIPRFAHARVAAGLPMPGVFLVRGDMPIGQSPPTGCAGSHFTSRLRLGILNLMKVSAVLKLLRDDGWYQVPSKGGHRQFKHPVKSGRVTVSGKASNELPPGTLNSILKQAGLKE